VSAFVWNFANASLYGHNLSPCYTVACTVQCNMFLDCLNYHTSLYRHEAERLEQEAKGRLERQKIMDEAEAERARKELLELQAHRSAHVMSFDTSVSFYTVGQFFHSLYRFTLTFLFLSIVLQ